MKVWMVRTKSNFLLGPITKSKLLELMESGSILPDDELSSGNGFWFFFRERDLVEKFIYGDEVQSFNPVSEALLERMEREVYPEPMEDDKDITLFNYTHKK